MHDVDYHSLSQMAGQAQQMAGQAQTMMHMANQANQMMGGMPPLIPS